MLSTRAITFLMYVVLASTNSLAAVILSFERFGRDIDDVLWCIFDDRY